LKMVMLFAIAFSAVLYLRSIPLLLEFFFIISHSWDYSILSNRGSSGYLCKTGFTLLLIYRTKVKKLDSSTFLTANST
jgi:hypothetical protein